MLYPAISPTTGGWRGGCRTRTIRRNRVQGESARRGNGVRRKSAHPPPGAHMTDGGHLESDHTAWGAARQRVCRGVALGHRSVFRNRQRSGQSGATARVDRTPAAHRHGSQRRLRPVRAQRVRRQSQWHPGGATVLHLSRDGADRQPVGGLGGDREQPQHLQPRSAHGRASRLRGCRPTRRNRSAPKRRRPT